MYDLRFFISRCWNLGIVDSPRESPHVQALALIIAISEFDYALNSRSRKTCRGRLHRGGLYDYDVPITPFVAGEMGFPRVISIPLANCR